MTSELRDCILVLGGDGYLGWPLSMQLAAKYPKHSIVIVDKLLRRKWVAQVGGESLLPIANPEQRLKTARDNRGINNLTFTQADIASAEIDAIVKKYRPSIVYHLAQQCSAPFSMSSCENAVDTLINNEAGNMRLLWALRAHAPKAHLIKLGTFGEYAKSCLDVAEGYFYPEYKGKRSDRPLPYPRESDDFYHASKINDSNYISVACRKWGLRVTDVMQSTVFGAYCNSIEGHSDLFTRFDYDESFGTVLNRFCAQALGGQPLTVYGSGHQRTGLMALCDSIDSLVSQIDHQPLQGQHRVINNVTETSFSVNDLAETLVGIAKLSGYAVTIDRGTHDPRLESPDKKASYSIEHSFVNDHVVPTSLKEVVFQTWKVLQPYSHRIKNSLFQPSTQWQQNPLLQKKSLVLDIDVLDKKGTETLNDGPAWKPDEEDWDAFRILHFPAADINLNPGTLGNVSEYAKKEMQNKQWIELQSYPLGLYQKGREAAEQSLKLVHSLWPMAEMLPSITDSASQISNLLALNISRVFTAQGKRKIRVFCTSHEHVGGIAAFERLEEFEIRYLSQTEMDCPEQLTEVASQWQPDIAFFSHVAYDTGEIFPLDEWFSAIRITQPACLCITDTAQSLGLLPLQFTQADFIFASCHKWLFGPGGIGLCWTSERFRQQIKGFYWSGEALLEKNGHFGFSGGRDFSALAGLKAALELYQSSKPNLIVERCAELSAYFVKCCEEKNIMGDEWEWLASPEAATSPAVVVMNFLKNDPYPLYQILNENGVHVKCIKSENINALRLGIPYFESKKRLERVVELLHRALGKESSTADVLSSEDVNRDGAKVQKSPASIH